jgi:hypothetical protein
MHIDRHRPVAARPVPYTTHLVCAPDDLATPAVVMEWLIPAGGEVGADVPLVRLVVAGESQLVLTPLAGVLTEHCVAIGEPLAASDLLAMIEAEEPEFGISLLPPEDEADNLSISACRRAQPILPPALGRPADEALALCAALGVSPDEVPCNGAYLAREDVERYVRRELRMLAAARDLLQR